MVLACLANFETNERWPPALVWKAGSNQKNVKGRMTTHVTRSQTNPDNPLPPPISSARTFRRQAKISRQHTHLSILMLTGSVEVL